MRRLMRTGRHANYRSATMKSLKDTLAFFVGLAVIAAAIRDPAFLPNFMRAASKSPFFNWLLQEPR
jgi:hypothetical protein